MEYKQIQELIKTINKSNISELTVEDGTFKITIKQEAAPIQYVTAPPTPAPIHHAAPVVHSVSAPGPAPVAEKSAVPVSTEASNTTTIKSPMIGTFYRSPSPDKPVFVNVGDEVKVGQVLCIIEAMKLFNEIESEVNGRLIKVVADDSSPVEYDQPLFIIEPM